MSALLLIYKGDDGQILNIPFAAKEGELMTLVEEMVDVMAGMGIAGGIWEGVAADRLRIILEQRRKLAEQRETIQSMRDAVGAMAL